MVIGQGLIVNAPHTGAVVDINTIADCDGSLNLFGIIAVVGAMAVSAGVWAWGHHTGGHQAEASGKKGVLVCAGAALLLGAANGIVAFFSTLGTQVH